MESAYLHIDIWHGLLDYARMRSKFHPCAARCLRKIFDEISHDLRIQTRERQYSAFRVFFYTSA